MRLAVFLFYGSRKNFCFRIVVYHCFGQDFIALGTLIAFQGFFHKGCHLIHIKVNIGNILNFDNI